MSSRLANVAIDMEALKETIFRAKEKELPLIHVRNNEPS